MSLEVIEPGWATLIVDGGRPSSRALGVPVGGAADRFSLALANGLVGNPPEMAGLEICLTGPLLRAATELACVVFGAPFELNSGRQNVRIGTTFTLNAGEELHIGGTPRGLRAYFAVRGGIDAATVLGSRSSLDPIQQGEVLPCSPSAIHSRFVPELEPRFEGEQALHVVPGLQASWFSGDEFYRQDFVLSTASNRMGLRLTGQPLSLPDRELVSEPVCPGAVQVTRDGQCIILGVDGQTIGGYPKIAQVICAELDALGQMRPGTRVRFQEIGLADAVARGRQAEAKKLEWNRRLRLSLGAFGRSLK